MPHAKKVVTYNLANGSVSYRPTRWDEEKKRHVTIDDGEIVGPNASQDEHRVAHNRQLARCR